MGSAHEYSVNKPIPIPIHVVVCDGVQYFIKCIKGPKQDGRRLMNVLPVSLHDHLDVIGNILLNMLFLRLKFLLMGFMYR